MGLSSKGMNYAKEYDEYWSRPDRWQSHSFDDAGPLVHLIETLCGRGSLLDAGCGMGLLVRTLAARGIDAHGVDAAARPVAENNRSLPGRFHLGSIISLPFPDNAFDTVISTDCLEHLSESDAPLALRELHRVTRRFAFIRLATKVDRDGRWHLCIHDRAWWEHQFFAAGFRKHPLNQLAVPFEALENESWQITLVLEKIPAAALAAYPLAALQPERDLHMDMLREPGRRSDAHLARYQMACGHLPREGGVVLDAACGLGYGSALLAEASPSVKVIGMDQSDFAVTYAERNFCPNRLNLSFLRGDVCALRAQPDASVDLVVAFEILAQLREPQLFLKEARRILKPGGRFLCSVPNLWVDQSGRDPDPRRFHVFDFAKLAALCGGCFDLRDVFRQTAGGGMKLPAAPRQLRPVHVPVTSRQDEAEWWLLAAEKPPAPSMDLLRRAGNRSVVVMTTHPGHSIYEPWLSRCPFPVTVLNPSSPGAEVPGDALLLVTHDTYTEPGRSLIRRAVEKGVPTLILADGVLDYRNTWEHPQIEPGAIFQPVLGHKIATIGRSQSRWVETWGNAGKCETVGLPRLDRHTALQRRVRNPQQPFRILINTAITPWFTETHHRQVMASLRDLKTFFEQNPVLNGVTLEPIWRLTKGLDAEIGVSSQVSDLSGHEMANVLQQVDAVITTPSTVILEAMLFGLPVAVLDYCNTPHYVPTAWRITAPTHIADTVNELLDPPEPKLLFQETCLHDSLECDTPATPRLLRLMTEMVDHGLRCREAGSTLALPPAILQPQNVPAVKENRFQMDRLYPSQPAIPPKPGRNDLASVDTLANLRDPAQLRALVSSAAAEGRLSDAVEACSRLLELNPRDTEALLNKAVFSARQKHCVLARILLQDLLRIDPDHVTARKCLAALPPARPRASHKPKIGPPPTVWPPLPTTPFNGNSPANEAARPVSQPA